MISWTLTKFQLLPNGGKIWVFRNEKYSVQREFIRDPRGNLSISFFSDKLKNNLGEWVDLLSEERLKRYLETGSVFFSDESDTVRDHLTSLFGS